MKDTDIGGIRLLILCQAAAKDPQGVPLWLGAQIQGRERLVEPGGQIIRLAGPEVLLGKTEHGQFHIIGLNWNFFFHPLEKFRPYLECVRKIFRGI